MLRVLFVTRKYPPAVGGMETLARDVVRSLEPGCELRLVALGRGNPALPLWYPVAVARLLWHAVLRRDVDRVLVGDVLLHVLLSPFLPLVRVPLATMVMGLDVTWPPRAYQRLLRVVLPRARRLVAISSATAQAARTAGADPDAVQVLRLAVDLPAGGPGRDAARTVLRERLGLPADAVVVTTLGRLVERKGVAWFSRDVVPQLPPGTFYVVAGGGPDLAALRTLQARQPGTPTTVVLGPVDDDVRELLLRGADLFVQPNVPVPGDMEGFGLVTLEATVRGVPVLASAIEGIQDVIDDGATGWLVPPGDVQAWVDAVRARLADPAGTRAEADRFAQEAARRFSLPRMGDDLLGLLQGVPTRPV